MHILSAHVVYHLDPQLYCFCTHVWFPRPVPISSYPYIVVCQCWVPLHVLVPILFSVQMLGTCNQIHVSTVEFPVLYSTCPLFCWSSSYPNSTQVWCSLMLGEHIMLRTQVGRWLFFYIVRVRSTVLLFLIQSIFLLFYILSSYFLSLFSVNKNLDCRDKSCICYITIHACNCIRITYLHE